MQKSRKVKTLSINTILFGISSFGTKFISFFLVPLYTYVLSTEDYGRLDLMTTTAQLLIPLLTLNIQDAVLRFALDKKYYPEETLNASMKIYGAGSVVLMFGIVLLACTNLLKLDASYLYFLFALFATHAVYNIFSMYLKATNKIKILVLCGILHTLLTCLLNILLLLVWKIGVVGYMIANVAGSLLAIAIMFFFGGIAGAIGKKRSPGPLKEMCLFSMPLIASAIAWWVNNASDRYILAFFCGVAVNGIYSVAYKIPTILSTVQNVFYNAWSISAITEFDKDDRDGFIGNIYETYSLLSFAVCSIVMLFNVFCARFLYANAFYQAWQFVPPLLLGTVFNGIALFEGCLFSAAKQTKAVSLTTVLGAVVNTVLNFLLIPRLGALGAAIATASGYFVIWAARTVHLRKIVVLKINWTLHIIAYIILLAQCALAVSFEQLYYQIPCVVLLVISQKKYIYRIVGLIKSKAYSFINEKNQG